MKKILLSALEPSANLHLRQILRTLNDEARVNSRDLNEIFEFVGIFDESLCEEFKLKTKPLYGSKEFSAMGFVEVLPLILKAKKAIKKIVFLALEAKNQNKPYDALLCIDSPAFHLPLAKALNKAGLKMPKIYYILPQVWAWKKGRIPTIEANFNVLASILPFEQEFYSKSTYVGHPLLDEIKEVKSSQENEASLLKSEKQKIIAFLPGSRKSEIQRLMPVFRELAKKFDGQKILCVPEFKLANLNKLYGDTSEFKVQSNTPKVLKNADFAFICSGTATLEAALVGTPFVLCYKAKAVDICIARLFVKLKYIGLTNIICDFSAQKPLNPEFLQDEVSTLNLYEAYEKFDYKEFFARISHIKEYLSFGSARNMAEILKNM